jgi:pyruvate dehydrogenase complex dehydrogenase (E1) component
MAEEPAMLAQSGLPPDMPGVWFVIDDRRFGFMGLGDRLAAAFDAKVRDFLMAATGAFTVFLRNASLYEEKNV